MESNKSKTATVKILAFNKTGKQGLIGNYNLNKPQIEDFDGPDQSCFG
jgi:hypothetical protein